MVSKPIPRSSEAEPLRNALARHLENPFLVLALATTTDLAGIERQGQKWLSMLAAGLGEAAQYWTPFGPRDRTAELVRSALSELREPERRLLAEFWAAGWGKAP